jgi:hypothetical protein
LDAFILFVRKPVGKCVKNLIKICVTKLTQEQDIVSLQGAAHLQQMNPGE